MERNYESDLSNKEKEEIIREIFDEKDYREFLESIGIKENSNIEVCNLAEFLITEHPEKFARTMGDENNYRSNEHLQKIYAIIDQEKGMAGFINTDKDGKMPEGEFGSYDLEANKFKPSQIVKSELAKYLGIEALEIEKQDEIIEEFFKDLNAMDKLATKDTSALIEEVRKNNPKINQKIEEKTIESNLEKGISEKETREMMAKENSGKSKDKDENDKQELKNSKLPKHILNYCLMAGISAPKAVIDTKASEAATKIDEPRINRNGGIVTIMKVRDTSKSIDKYLVFQDNKLIIPGNRDEKIDNVVGDRMQHTKNGQFIQPLEIDDEEQYFSYDDFQGIDIDTKFQESQDMSIDDLENYKKELKENLDYFREQMNKIDEDPMLGRNPVDADIERDAQRYQLNEMFNKENQQIAIKYGINVKDMEIANEVTDEVTQKEIDEEQPEERPQGGRARGEDTWASRHGYE